MLSFKDLNGNQVDLTFKKQYFIKEAGHVLVVLKYQGKWLLTQHKKRGIEFPGGKREPYETVFDAAKRETFEETGVTISSVKKIAQYIVHEENPFCKTVFTGWVAQIDDDYERHETDGAVWMTDEELDACETLSFYMKDEGMSAIRKWVDTYEN